MGTVQPFGQFVRELETESHPPLLHLLLRAGVPPTSSTLVPRLPGLAAGLASVVLVHAVALRLGLPRAYALTGALAAGIATDAVSMAACVRGYMLANAFTLAALLAVLCRRPRWFGAMALGALGSEYSAGMPVVALAFWLRRELWRDRIGLGLLAVAGVGTGAWLGWTAPGSAYNHLAAFLPAGRPLPVFLWQALAAEFRLFAPLAWPEPVAAALGLLVLGLATWRWRADAAAAALASTSWLLVLLAACARYPLGGNLRQQFVLWPFLLLGMLGLLAALGRRLRLSAWPAAAAALCIGLLAWSGLRDGSRDEVPAVAIGHVETAVLRELLPAGASVCVDAHTSVVLFGNLREQVWRRVDGHQGNRCFVVGDPARLRVWRDFAWDHPSPPFALLAELMRQRGIERLAWFSLPQLGAPHRIPGDAAQAAAAGVRLLDSRRIGRGGFVLVAR